MTSNIQYMRTNRAISTAFLNLLSKKPFAKITVQDILDSTPVSRATFYKHYHDKYEIAERLHTELMQSYSELFDALAENPPESFSLLVAQHGQRNLDTAQTMMQVRTENVDLPRALNEEARTRYLSGSYSDTADMEASVYGAAVSAFFMELLENRYHISQEDLGRVLRAVGLRLMALSDAQVKR